MAATTVQAKSAPATPPSTILALHARYERAWEEYNRVDEAQPSNPKDHNDPDWSLHFGCKYGMERNSEETTLLRRTLLHQVPSTDEELSILAFHAWGTHDEHAELGQKDREALYQALTSIFDYLMSEGHADAEALGGQLSSGAICAWETRRYRTGLLPQD